MSRNVEIIKVLSLKNREFYFVKDFNYNLIIILMENKLKKTLRCRSISTYAKNFDSQIPSSYCTHLLTCVRIGIDDPSLPPSMRMY
jgi:hypothetical protein